jgi:hypothetical protein
MDHNERSTLVRHFTSFLNQVRDLKERAAGLEAEVHYGRLDAVLNALCITQITLPYRDLAKILGVFSARLGAMLGRRMEDDHANQEPLSSALIVNRNTGISSPGFFEMARSLGYVIHDPQQFWQQQCDACFARFSEVTIGLLLNTGLLDDEQEKVERIDSAIATVMIQAGITDRAVWSGETSNDRRVLRLRIGNRTAMELPEREFAAMPDDQVVARLRQWLRL